LVNIQGAAAVLEFNAITSPLAQPRNSIFGHTLSAFVGVCFGQMMLLSSKSPNTLAWLLAPLACGTASALMTLLNSVYPPGGATAVLAVADPVVRALGWNFVLLVFLASLLMLGVALLVNNVMRRYPMWWWSPLETGAVYCRRRRSSDDGGGVVVVVDIDVEMVMPKNGVADAEQDSIHKVEYVRDAPAEESIVLAANGMLSLPNNIQIDDQERAVLLGLLQKLQAPKYGRSVTEKSWSGDAEPP